MQRKVVPAMILFVLGALSGLFLMSIATWGDYESTSYGFAQRANGRLRGLNCPILLTRNETGMILLRLSNRTDRVLHPSVRTELSAEFEPQVFNEFVELSPGETRELEWTVGSENIDLGNFILASVQAYAYYPNPNLQTTCGILVVDLPGRGLNIVVILGVSSLIGMGLGLYSMKKGQFRNESMSNRWNALRVLAVVIAGGIVLSFVGSWLPSVVLLVVALLICFLIVFPLNTRDS
jgi:hypothetical protein